MLFHLFHKTKLKRRIKSFAFAANGLKIFFKSQCNALIHLIATITVITTGYYLNLNYYEWCIIILAIGIVFIAEVFNTAIEFLTNLVSPQYNKAAGQVKDLSAAGVLVAVVTAVILGIIVFFQRFEIVPAFF